MILKKWYSTEDDIFLDAKKDVFQYLSHANDKCEWAWNEYTKYVTVGFTVLSFVSWLAALGELIIKKEEFHTDGLYSQFKFTYVFYSLFKHTISVPFI